MGFSVTARAVGSGGRPQRCRAELGALPKPMHPKLLMFAAGDTRTVGVTGAMPAVPVWRGATAANQRLCSGLSSGQLPCLKAPCHYHLCINQPCGGGPGPHKETGE